jgi:hypothetical protein
MRLATIPLVLMTSSATEYYQLVITVPGQIESASTLPYQRLLTAESHGVIGAVFTISKFVVPFPQLLPL